MEHLNNLPPFYVGQKVICIESHPSRIVSKDEKYTIKQVIKSCCGYIVDIGKACNGEMECRCGKPIKNNGIYLLYSKRFRPLQEQTFPLISMKKVLEEQLVCSN